MLGFSTKPIAELRGAIRHSCGNVAYKTARRPPTSQGHPIRRGSCQRRDSTAKKLFPLLNFLSGFGMRITKRCPSHDDKLLRASVTSTASLSDELSEVERRARTETAMERDRNCAACFDAWCERSSEKHHCAAILPAHPPDCFPRGSVRSRRSMTSFGTPVAPLVPGVGHADVEAAPRAGEAGRGGRAVQGNR
jgi:hypothetical protein